jgi:predicted Zn finger-like uncharacterized protein
MEVTCEQCKTKLNIPDEKLPKGQVVKLGCPKCKNKITIDTRSTPPHGEEAPPGAGADDTGKFHLKFIESKREKEQEEGYGYSEYTDDKALDFFEEGARLALIMSDDPEHIRKIKELVEGMGFKGVVTPNTRDAIGKLRFHHFDLMLLSDGFDGQPLENSPILNHVNRMPMSVRRRIFLALLGEKFKSMDNMMAFAMSANVVLSTKDMDRLGPMLKMSLGDNEKFYKVFIDTLTQLGKV